jgi:glycine C-acetyltransferase
MNSHALVELQRMPFHERVARHHALHEEEVRQGCLLGREGDGPVEPVQSYRDLFGPDFRDVLNFGTNNYLGLSTHPEVRKKVCEAVHEMGVGSGGSPAFSGYTSRHRRLERRLAALAGHDDAVLLPSGFMANLCWVSGLLRRQDVLVYDRHSHASVVNAVKMAGIPFYTFDPDDLDGLDRLLGEARRRSAGNAQIFSTIEGVRSIDGCVADIGRWIEICKGHGVVTVLDDAHGLGSVGQTGKGTLEHLGLLGQVDFRMSTCSKAMGAQGAFVSGSSGAIFYLRSLSHPYVFTTALAHPTIAAIDAALDVLESSPDLVEALHGNVAYLRGRWASRRERAPAASSRCTCPTASRGRSTARSSRPASSPT